MSNQSKISSLTSLNDKLKYLFLKGPDKLDMTNTNKSFNKFNDNNDIMVT